MTWRMLMQFRPLIFRAAWGPSLNNSNGLQPLLLIPPFSVQTACNVKGQNLLRVSKSYRILWDYPNENVQICILS